MLFNASYAVFSKSAVRIYLILKVVLPRKANLSLYRIVVLMARTLKEYACVFLRPEQLSGPIDFLSIFGRCGPVHIEIGSGKGTWLLNQAMAHPEVNFLGIEWARRYYRFAVDRMGRWAVKNVRLIRTNAADFLADFVPADSVDCYHIYFPDPWPRKRHNKRRLLGPENLEHLLRTLKLGGIIQVVTDYGDYFQVISELLQANRSRLRPVDFVPAAGARQGELVGTNYERKYLAEKRPLYAIAVSKKGMSSGETE